MAVDHAEVSGSNKVYCILDNANKIKQCSPNSPSIVAQMLHQQGRRSTPFLQIKALINIINKLSNNFNDPIFIVVKSSRSNIGNWHPFRAAKFFSFTFQGIKILSQTDIIKLKLLLIQ